MGQGWETAGGAARVGCRAEGAGSRAQGGEREKKNTHAAVVIRATLVAKVRRARVAVPFLSPCRLDARPARPGRRVRQISQDAEVWGTEAGRGGGGGGVALRSFLPLPPPGASPSPSATLRRPAPPAPPPQSRQHTAKTADRSAGAAEVSKRQSRPCQSRLPPNLTFPLPPPTASAAVAANSRRRRRRRLRSRPARASKPAGARRACRHAAFSSAPPWQ